MSGFVSRARNLAFGPHLTVFWTNEWVSGFPPMSVASGSDSDALEVRGGLVIPRAELVVRATRASGPGGQHVNTSSTRIELLWNVKGSSVLTEEERALLVSRLGRRIDSEGWLRIVASASRSQLRNRRQAEEQLVVTVRKALHVAAKRRATRPTRASREERLRTKRMQSRKKADRRAGADD